MQDHEKDEYDRDFARLYEEYFGYMVRYLAAIIRDFTGAEDLVHDIFIRMYKNRKIPPGDLLKSRNYMIKSAKNMAIDYLRKQKRDELKFIKIIPDHCNKNEGCEIYNIVIEGFIASTVNDVLKEFPQKKREIFFERVFEEKSMTEIAERTELSPHKIKKIELEIFNRLKQQLKDFK